MDDGQLNGIAVGIILYDMGTEIERKFLVVDDAWREGAPAMPIRQGYLMTGALTVRVRTMGERAVLTLKKPLRGIARHEFEYEIPAADAEFMLNELCEGHVVEKTRYEVEFGGMAWVVDVFEGENAGLVVAEIELSAEEQVFERPPWLGAEVSEDARYLNSNLSQEPYCEW